MSVPPQPDISHSSSVSPLITVRFKDGRSLDINSNLFPQIIVTECGVICTNINGKATSVLYDSELVAEDKVYRDAQSQTEKMDFEKKEEEDTSSKIGNEIYERLTKKEVSTKCTELANFLGSKMETSSIQLDSTQLTWPAPNDNSYSTDLKFNLADESTNENQRRNLINLFLNSSNNRTRDSSNVLEQSEFDKISSNPILDQMCDELSVSEPNFKKREKRLKQKLRKQNPNFSDGEIEKENDGVIKKVKTEADSMSHRCVSDKLLNITSALATVSSTEFIQTNNIITVSSSPAITAGNSPTRPPPKKINLAGIPKRLKEDDPLVVRNYEGRWVMPAHYHIDKLEDATKNKIKWSIMRNYEPSYDTFKLHNGKYYRLWGLFLIPENIKTFEELRKQKIISYDRFPESEYSSFVNRLRTNPSKIQSLISQAAQLRLTQQGKRPQKFVYED